MISAETRLIALLGYPVEHSLSPLFQNRALQFLRLPFVYLAFAVEPKALPKAVEALLLLNARGFNVTIPHKEGILPLIDVLSEEVRILGAINTVVNEKGRLFGYNTDVFGFAKSLEEEGVNLGSQNVLLFGAGGVSRAILAVLKREKVNKLYVANRTLHRAHAFAEWGRSFSSFPIEVVSWEEALEGKGLTDVFCIINATSLGLQGETIPLSWKSFPSCQVVVDTVYRRGQTTPFVEEAWRRGKKAFDGKGMLLYQGAKSFELFTEVSAPLSVMKEALDYGEKGSR